MTRRGGALSGCLVWMVLLVVAVYAGSAIGAPYYRYYRFSDIVNQEESFATIQTDDVMRHTIWATADSLGLPDDAYHLQIARDAGRVHISASYDDFWALPGYRRVVHFTVDDSSPLL